MSQFKDHSRWRSFRAFPLMGQISIWFGVALSGLLAMGIVGAIAASPDPDPTSAAVVAGTTSPATTVSVTTTASASTTTTASTMVTTTLPATTIVAIAAVPATDTVAVMTAEIVDGDTITMSDGSTVRLIGIDTPERGQCGYDEAGAVLAQLIDGQNITLVAGARDDVDKYGRLLRYVEVNGVDVDLEMIERGRAIARYDGRDGYGVHARQDAYVQADDLTPSTNVCTTVVTVAVVPIAVVPVTTAPVSSNSPAEVHYKNCTAVRAAGAAPIRPGDPGWQSKFDANNDGVGCE